MARYRYGVVARFAEGKNVYGGQTIKTRNFTEELEAFLGKEQVYRGDTSGWQKKPLKLVRQMLFALRHCQSVVILPAPRGIRVIPRLLMLLRGFRKTKLQYVVVGGWLPELTKKKKGIARCLKKFDGIFVETQTMKNAMDAQGFTNVSVLPNFKRMQVLREEELVYASGEPYRLCTFSRVLKEKGIEDAVNAVNKANAALGRTAYALDIYGRVDARYEEEFAALQQAFPENIRYMGAADGSKSAQIIKDYFALLFPTHFYTEGIPGTIIDTYAAGVPVLFSRWESFADIVDDGKTGIGYAFAQENALLELLLEIAETPQRLLDMKQDCLKKSSLFSAEAAIKEFCCK